MPVVFANRAFEQLFDIEPGIAEGQDVGAFLEGDGDPARIEEIVRGDGSTCQVTLASPQAAQPPLRATLTLLQGDRYILVRIAAEAISPPAKAEVKVELLQRELDRARESNAKIDRRDADTGLLCYRSFLELCERDFALCSRQGRELAVLVFTVREFDVYRDTYGDKAAQSCLRMVGGRIAGGLRRAGDLCARFDEASFVALITGHALEQAEQFAEHIAAQVRGLALHHPRASGERYVTCSVGLQAGVPGPRDGPEQFVMAAAQCQELTSGQSAA